MATKSNVNFTGGGNIAIKTPAHTFDQTISFYRDVLKLPVLKKSEFSYAFQFGKVCLWIDRVANISHADIWLEVGTDDTSAASTYLEDQGVLHRDEVEDLPDGFDGFWVSSPSGVIHLVAGPEV